MTEASMVWDPTSCNSTAFSARDNDEKWTDRHWMNVPGPFYTGVTDNCWTGRLHAPRHILYGGDFYNEFVYRQPRSREEVESLIVAAEQDPCYGYACDGDSRWTPDAVRGWWRDRGLVREHLEALLTEWSAEAPGSQETEAAEGVRDFLGYLAGDLKADLRAYIYRLEQGRYPDADARLPRLRMWHWPKIARRGLPH
ncbi:hypothetical protein [Actinospica robiniae]|uniref:hypothetical protein n=1 Tax=Actinospica robiniae TaxID=304901 RepID=UPI000429BB6D|nr:hypothetical protein [Actinospica robiniae]